MEFKDMQETECSNCGYHYRYELGVNAPCPKCKYKNIKCRRR